MSVAPAPVVILISGRGSNLKAILDEVRTGRLPAEIRVVISNNPDAEGLRMAQVAGIRTVVISGIRVARLVQGLGTSEGVVSFLGDEAKREESLTYVS